jgi:translation initiation factor IF-3
MQYEQSKKEKQQRKIQNKVSKTVQLKPNIGENDLLRKILNIRKFLDKGYRVVVQVTMKGRQRRHSRLAEDQTINRISKEIEDAVMESSQYQGGRITAVFVKNEQKAPAPETKP